MAYYEETKAKPDPNPKSTVPTPRHTVPQLKPVKYPFKHENRCSYWYYNLPVGRLATAFEFFPGPIKKGKKK